MAGIGHLLKDSSPPHNIPQRNRPSGVDARLFSASINGSSTEFSLIKYSNRIFITVTESKKIGNLYSIHLDSPQKNGLFAQGPSVFEIKCLLGSDTEEKTVAVRALVEKLAITEPILLSLTITNFDYSTISAIADAINSKKCW